jgi:hypothetical protein
MHMSGPPGRVLAMQPRWYKDDPPPALHVRFILSFIKNIYTGIYIFPHMVLHLWCLGFPKSGTAEGPLLLAC